MILSIKEVCEGHRQQGQGSGSQTRQAGQEGCSQGGKEAGQEGRGGEEEGVREGGCGPAEGG